MNENTENKWNYLNLQIDKEGLAYIRPDDTKIAEPNYVDQLEQFIESAIEVLSRSEVRGLIYQSPIRDAEPDFTLLYAYLNKHANLAEQAAALFSRWDALKKNGKPVVALIEGNSFSLQLASTLWADYRIATSDANLGFTELKQGLFPGFGATTLSIRLLGLERALSFLFAGNALAANQAKELGIVDQLATGLPQALEHAKQWIKQGAQVIRNEEQLAPEKIEPLLASIRQKSNALIPAHQAWLDLLGKSYPLQIADAVQQDHEAWFTLWQRPETVSMLRTLHQHVGQARALSTSTDERIPKLHKLGVIGAGIMGSGIAYEAARAGIAVVLKDTDQTIAERGKAYAEKVSDKLVQRGALSAPEQQELLKKIHPTAALSDLRDSDIIIEAVFEDQALKAAVIAESQSFLNNQGIFASNTTSLPITTLARFAAAPQNFIGLHFFSPVDRMPLVEIIRGKETSDTTLRKALQAVQQLKKIPIVVFDGPAFFTSRIFFNYLLEAITMLLEGIPAKLIEQEAHNAGFASSPLAVLDEISLKLMLQVYDQLPTLHASQRRCYTYLQTLIERGRQGKRSGLGFYTYDKETNKKIIWEDPSIKPATSLPTGQTLQKRLLHVMALDSFRCLAEGVLSSPADGDIGSILGVGYAIQTGGVFGHIDQIGLQTFTQDCLSFADHGEQWLVPPSLIQLAADDFSFYTGFRSNWPTTALNA